MYSLVKDSTISNKFIREKCFSDHMMYRKIKTDHCKIFDAMNDQFSILKLFPGVNKRSMHEPVTLSLPKSNRDGWFGCLDVHTRFNQSINRNSN